MSTPGSIGSNHVQVVLHGGEPLLLGHDGLLLDEMQHVKLAGQARHRFRMYRSWVEEAIEALLNAGALTPQGKRFVNGMRDAVGAWSDDR